ncbi:MAG TPA: 23S rRNA (cytidine(2498)-2'-O)-methyltransferase RlmM [Polyangiales bacterium]
MTRKLHHGRGKPGRAHDARNAQHPKAKSEHGAQAGPSRDQRSAQARARAQAHARNPSPTAAEPALPRDVQARLGTINALLQRGEPLRVGEWLWTCREGSERDVIEELLLRGDLRPRLLAPALIASRKAPADAGERLDLTFARQGLPVSLLVHADNVAQLAEQLATHLVPLLSAAEGYALHVFVPDSTQSNPLSQRAQSLGDQLGNLLHAALANHKRLLDSELRRASVPLAQVCLYAHDDAAAGVLACDRALSTAAGGRTRMRLDGAAPSRAARKLEEAFAWLGVSPGPGELCVDLGAAPGGWSWLLLERRARVIAVDPARMDPKLAVQRRLTHVQGSAFDFAPEEPVDWLFCDMAWRPLEVAQMLARWGRRRFTRLLVANFKLPMKRKAEMVQRIRATLTEGGFTAIRTRQLYHDRDEITLTARVR